ncbi:MAG: J domain-containing protein [Acidimicrobiia bacterium]
MILAELNVRHTRRHMPTRRVALGDHYLPTSGAGYGAVLLGAVVADSAPDLDPEQHDALGRFLDDARSGRLAVPRIALRYRLQTDVHGLDRSRHRIVGEAGGDGGGAAVVLELDVHGRADPQLIGAVMAAVALPSTDGRRLALRAIDGALTRPGVLPEGLTVRRLYEGVPGARPSAPGAGPRRNGDRPLVDPWRSVPADRRWAMEVLGLGAGMSLVRDDVQRRFRRLVRLAHPDHGAMAAGAAERIAELTEARELLLAVVAAGSPERARR